LIDIAGGSQTSTDLAVEDRHHDEDADDQRVDEELAVEVGAVNATAERLVHHQIEIVAGRFVGARCRNYEVRQAAYHRYHPERHDLFLQEEFPVTGFTE